MRSFLLWLSGVAVAFVLTAGAFLTLANLGGGLPEKSLTAPEPPADPGPSLQLLLDKDILKELERRPNQTLTLGVENRSQEQLPTVNLTVEVSSENTSLGDVRRYRATVEDLAAGETKTVFFDIDLSPARQESGRAGGLQPPARILEVRATTPEGLSAVRTAILPS
jgi:hypothetical protein